MWEKNEFTNTNIESGVRFITDILRSEETISAGHIKQKSCPRCGRKMKLTGEKYQFDDPYEDIWYECTSCGCTLEAACSY